MIKILLIDDHQIVLDGLRLVIDQEPAMEVVAVGKNGMEACKLANALPVDVILMDVDMPVMNGLVALKKIKEENKNAKVIMLTLHLEKSLIQHCIQSGADGYLHKNADKSEVIRALQEVANGRKYFSQEASLTLAGMEVVENKTKTRHDEVLDLTAREIEILKSIAEGLSSKEIGEKLFISPRTVDTHRNNMMKKLGVNKIAGLIKLAYVHGIME